MASYLFPLWVGLGLVIPAVLGGVITLSWGGVWTGLIWGGLVRIFLSQHAILSINSVCHLVGSRPCRFRFAGEERMNRGKGENVCNRQRVIGVPGSPNRFVKQRRRGIRKALEP